jgi:tRNA dimethylallyltransferase
MAVLAVVGPTASGKSAVAMDAARRRIATGLPTQIVAVDAFTVYRGMDVGTAKPSLEDRDEVPHHLVDILDPTEELTVADFQTLARDTIAGLHAAGATPLLVGGSGLYWRAVVDDLRFPPTDPEVRAALEERWRNDPDGAHAHLAELDPDAADRIEPANLRRTIRALEVLELTGERFSAYDDGWDRYDSILGDVEVVYLEPPAEDLRHRIHERARRMVAGRLLDEAAALRATYGPLSRTAAQAIGYAEAFAVLDGDLPQERLAEAIATRTWRYAKRQRGWFRADPRCVPTDPAKAVAALTG